MCFAKDVKLCWLIKGPRTLRTAVRVLPHSFHYPLAWSWIPSKITSVLRIEFETLWFLSFHICEWSFRKIAFLPIVIGELWWAYKQATWHNPLQLRTRLCRQTANKNRGEKRSWISIIPLRPLGGMYSTDHDSICFVKQNVSHLLWSYRFQFHSLGRNDSCVFW